MFSIKVMIWNHFFKIKANLKSKYGHSNNYILAEKLLRKFIAVGLGIFFYHNEAVFV